MLSAGVNRRRAAPSIAATSDTGWDYDKVATRSDWDLESLHITKDKGRSGVGGKGFHTLHPPPPTPETYAMSDNDDDVASSHLSYIEDNKHSNLDLDCYQDYVCDWKEAMEALKTKPGSSTPRTKKKPGGSSQPILLTPLELSILNPDSQAKATSSSVSVVSSLEDPSLPAMSIHSDQDEGVLRKDHKKSKIVSWSKNKRAKGWSHDVEASTDVPEIPTQEELEAVYEQLQQENCPSQEELALRCKETSLWKNGKKNTSSTTHPPPRLATTSGALVGSHSTIKQQRIQARQNRRRTTYLSKSCNAVLADPRPLLHSYDFGHQEERDSAPLLVDPEHKKEDQNQPSQLHSTKGKQQHLLGRHIMKENTDNDELWIDESSKKTNTTTGGSSSNGFLCLFQCFLPTRYTKRHSLECTEAASDGHDSEDVNVIVNGSYQTALQHKEKDMDRWLRRGSF